MIGDNLKILRDKTGLSQKAFAEINDMNPATLASYELGKREPNINMLIRFSQIYGVSVDYLIGNSLPGSGDYIEVLKGYEQFGNDLHDSYVQLLNSGIKLEIAAEVFEMIIHLKDCIRNLDTALSADFNVARESVQKFGMPVLDEIQLDGSPAKPSENPSNMLYQLSFMAVGIDRAIMAKDELIKLLETLLENYKLSLLNSRYRLAAMKDESKD